MLPDTLPKCLQHQVESNAGQIAMRQKDRGIWRAFTWSESYQQVRSLGLGLMALGIDRGDKVCIIGDNDPQYYWAQLAIQAAGGVAVGIYTDSTASEIQYIVEHSDATFVFAKDQEQCDKLLSIRELVPAVRRVLYWDDRGMWSYDEPWLMNIAEAQALGKALDQAEPDRFDRAMARGHAEDLAIFCYTSGTTGQPKGAMISHSNLLAGCDGVMQVDPQTAKDEYVSFLPPAWITENVLGLAVHLRSGMIVNFPEAPETVQENIREIAPNILFYSARLWENLVAMVQARMTEASWLNRELYRRFMPIGYIVARLRYEKRRQPHLGLRFLWWLGDLALFAPLRDKMGLIRVRSAYSSGAAQSPDVIRFFRAIGVNIKQLYGSTEATTHTLHVGEDVRFESVGVPVPGLQVRVDDEGEIHVSGPSVFQGYYKNPEATAKALRVDADGNRWFRTGDAGYLDDNGHLIYLDRMVDMISLAGGDKYSPQFIEGQLKFSPYIRDVMTIGGADRPFVTALITIDFDNVGRWAERHGLPYTTFVDLSQKPEIYGLIRRDVKRVNSTLPPAARLRRFVLMHKEFDPDEAELTRTRKLRRGLLRERYQEIIEAMYDGTSEVRVTAAVKYRDGREGVIETTVHVEALAEEEVQA
ncbi:MAG TPA: AMP-binding protein [Anaerolineales bacterium]|nr:AMP-binding protein [Anaerolineales bacterium]